MFTIKHNVERCAGLIFPAFAKNAPIATLYLFEINDEAQYRS